VVFSAVFAFFCAEKYSFWTIIFFLDFRIFGFFFIVFGSVRLPFFIFDFWGAFRYFEAVFDCLID
jgi:hypothetical protein